MKKQNNLQDVVGQTLAEFGTIPGRGLIYIGAIGLASAATALISWTHRSNLLLIDYLIAAVLLISGLAMGYAVSMLMIRSPWSITGLGKFIATTVALWLPVLLGVGLLMLSAWLEIGLGVAIAFALLFGGAVVAALLPGWPILQATSPKLVGPIEAYRSTKGIRWPLLLIGLMAIGVNRVVPRTGSADDFAAACVLAVGNAFATCASAMLALSLAVVAWKHMQPERPPLSP